MAFGPETTHKLLQMNLKAMISRMVRQLFYLSGTGKLNLPK